MKKFLSVVMLVTVLALSIFGCSSVPKQFTGEWKFSQIIKVEFTPDLSQDILDNLKQEYNAEDEEGILNNAFAKFAQDQTFANVYLKFGKKYTYTYDPFMEREATWVFYQTGENDGFISFYAELDVNDGNPDPVTHPELSYKADTDTMHIVIRYSCFMVTLELTR